MFDLDFQEKAERRESPTQKLARVDAVFCRPFFKLREGNVTEPEENPPDRLCRQWRQ
jgi:hypothetical protein